MQEGYPMQVVHESRPVVPRDRLVRLPEVERLTGCKKSKIYELMREGEDKFPQSIRLHRRMVAWSESAVLQWVQDRIAEAEAAKSTEAEEAAKGTKTAEGRATNARKAAACVPAPAIGGAP